MDPVRRAMIQQRIRLLQNYYPNTMGAEEDHGACSKVYHKFGIRHLALLLVIMVYAFIGGAIFRAIEGPAEMKAKEEADIRAEVAAKALAETIGAMYEKPDEPSCFIPSAGMKHEVYEEIMKHYQDLNVGAPTKVNWDYWGSVFYVGTIFTTIGYGHYAPATTAGRIATIIYALIGIPLLLAALNDLGKLLTRGLKIPYNLFRRGVNSIVRRFRRRNAPKLPPNKQVQHADQPENNTNVLPTQEQTDVVPENGEKAMKKEKVDGQNEDDLFQVEEETEEEQEEFNFPIPVVIIMLISWICISAKIFQIWEDWDYFTSFYFFFVSLTTIGLGDVVPQHTKYTIMAFPLVFFGLSLLSMVINLIQIKMEEMRAKALEMLESQIEGEEDGANGIGNLAKRLSGTFRPTLGILQGSSTNFIRAMLPSRKKSKKIPPKSPVAAKKQDENISSV